MDSRKKPLVLMPAGPFGWNSHNYILPELAKVWRDLSTYVDPIWFPRPRLSQEWLSRLRHKASCLVFPLGIGHYQGLRTLKLLRTKHEIRIPAIIMLASDLTKGFRTIFDFKEIIDPSADFFVTNCIAEAKLVMHALGNVSTAVIPLPVNKNRNQSTTQKFREAYKRSIGLGSKEPLVVYAGRVSLQKNIHSVLIAFSHLRTRLGSGHLVIAGPYDDVGLTHFPIKQNNRYLHVLADWVNHLGLENHVTFRGPLDQIDLFSLLAASDVNISLTLHSGEDFGYTIAQGISLGTPTIVTQWGGGIDFVKHQGAMGIPVKLTDNGPGIDIADVVEALFRILRPEENSQWRASAKNCANNYFETSRVSKRWKALFRKVKNQTRFSEVKKLKPTKLFWNSYARQLVDKSGAHSLFPSPGDPLYRLVTKTYGAK